MKALQKQTGSILRFLEKLPKVKRDYRYDEGKWTIREILQHIIDAERIFAYRALCFSRRDATPLPSFDENSYVANSKAENRKWKDLVNEFLMMRWSHEYLFGSFDSEQLETEGSSGGQSNYVLAIGFIIVGHASHHIKIIKERYLNATPDVF